MVDTLATLIKLSAQKVEKIQVQLAAAQRQLAQIHAEQQRWKTEREKANRSALESISRSEAEALCQAELFSRRVDNELAALAKIETVMNDNIAKIMQTLNTLFAEQKRYEILHEQKLLAERKKHAKKVQGELDEISGQKKRSAT
jgi:flagellar export protein FliJ